jgi:hypothetical protein
MNALKVIDFRTHGLDSEVDDAYSCLPDTVDPRDRRSRRSDPL